MYLILYSILLMVILIYWIRKKYFFYSTYFFLIGLYSIPTLYGSYHHPELLDFFGASVRCEVIDEALFFSGISSVLLHFFLMLSLPNLRFTKCQIRIYNRRTYGYLILMILFTSILFLEIRHSSEISYLNLSQNIDFLGFPLKLLSFLVKSSWVILLYLGLLILNSVKAEHVALLIFTVGVLILSYFSFKAGNRSDFVIFFLGLMVYFIMKYGIKKLLSLPFAMFIIGFLFFMNFIELDRQNIESPMETTLVQSLLLKDYFAPFLILTAAIDNSFVKPILVINSNFHNFFGFVNYPVLQEDLGNIMRPGSSSRTEGFGFFPFAEGYIFFGLLGVFYNVFVFGSVLKFYNWLGHRFNRYIFVPIFTSQLVYLVRSQSIYSVRFLIFQFSFIILLNFFLNDYRKKISLELNNCKEF